MGLMPTCNINSKPSADSAVSLSSLEHFPIFQVILLLLCPGNSALINVVSIHMRQLGGFLGEKALQHQTVDKLGH